MAWESRNGRGRYYTTTRRVGGRRCRHYFGAGVMGELAATLDAIRRVERETRERQERAERERLDRAGRLVGRLTEAADLALAAALTAAGFRRHARGQWRRVRDVQPHRDAPGGRARPGRGAGIPAAAGRAG
jgi:hypothetical protein